MSAAIPAAVTPGGRYRWRICAMLLAATTINYIDRQVLGVLAPFLQETFSWSEIDYGYIVTAFLVVILGGLGSILGTTYAALMIGLFMALSQIVVDVSFAQVLTLVFVIIFLQFRPQGVIAVKSRALDGE